jgi:hypothetical protein
MFQVNQKAGNSLLAGFGYVLEIHLFPPAYKGVCLWLILAAL